MWCIRCTQYTCCINVYSARCQQQVKTGVRNFVYIAHVVVYKLLFVSGVLACCLLPIDFARERSSLVRFTYTFYTVTACLINIPLTLYLLSYPSWIVIHQTRLCLLLLFCFCLFFRSGKTWLLIQLNVPPKKQYRLNFCKRWL